jgi:hypothetical protein
MYLLKMAQNGMKVAGAKMLAADVLTEEDVLEKGAISSLLDQEQPIRLNKCKGQRFYHCCKLST